MGLPEDWMRVPHFSTSAVPGPVTLSSDEVRLLIRCLDLTSLGADDTTESISRLLAAAEGAPEPVATLCVYPFFLSQVSASNFRTCVVAGGFPHGLSSLESQIAEISGSTADEIDVVIPRVLALEHRWDELWRRLSDLREACPDKTLKVILATGELRKPETIYGASMVAMAAGADFIKTSTGKETVNATPEAGLVMCAAIREFYKFSGRRVGIKAAGGIRDCAAASVWLQLVRGELGEEWLRPELFRIGASALLGDLVALRRQG